MSYTPRLKKDYKERVISELKKQFSYKSVMQVPKIIKIVVSKGVGAAVADKKLVEHAKDELTFILKFEGCKERPTTAVLIFTASERIKLGKLKEKFWALS